MTWRDPESPFHLRAISLTYIATALIFATASVFQGIGNTRLPFVSSLLRVLVLAVPVAILSHTSFFNLNYVWYISAGSIFIAGDNEPGIPVGANCGTKMTTDAIAVVAGV